MDKYHFEVKGRTPLLMHQDDVLAGDELKAWREDPENKNFSVKGDDRSPPWTWTTYLYHDGEHLTIPQEVIMAAIMAAGGEFKLKGNTTFKRLTQSDMMSADIYCLFKVDGKQIPIQPILDLGRSATFPEHLALVRDLGFRLFVKRAPVQKGGSKHVRVRPRFDNWSVEGTLLVTAPEFTRERVEQILAMAFRYKGLCDWRPNAPKSPGPYGQGELTLTRVR